MQRLNIRFKRREGMVAMGRESKAKASGPHRLPSLAVESFPDPLSDRLSIGLPDLYCQLFRETSNGVVIYRAVDDGDDFVILDLNPAVERIEKVCREAVIGRRVTEVFPGVAAFGILEVFRDVWKSGTPQHHPLGRYSDGRVSGWRENRVFRLTSGEVVAVYEDRSREVEIEQAEAHHALLATELNHRLLNAAHVVEVIVRESLKSDPYLARVIKHRIRAGLAGLKIHGRAATEPISVRELLSKELAPFGRHQISMRGRGLPLLPGRLRTVVTLAAHELATNAIKHGALSNSDGRVSINWRINKAAIKLGWSESGGPVVRPPVNLGYGSAMLCSLIEAQGGTLVTNFRPEGLRAEISLPR